jgi:hypothetical protein
VQSAAKTIIIKVEANEGKYSFDHGIANPVLPVIIYYVKGAVFVGHGLPGAVPEAFQDLPPFPRHY